ncbi:hypothetical protein H696_03883 [Fonticula alba]|uniref:Striatin N-terminal domain-containing protein n=1 Tax=Fonticula alba TaxID=691883 RepID=A0A058Z5D0_FONAL|nr:hypothetical protein H696_03883 [Fonticula alba]KCV69454.1 hypothetical protein H696_03883 [Fonticula alba]|eukprot:XP_009496019.1 hypothetical protein H696_03883 [Fonticula alba]
MDLPGASLGASIGASLGGPSRPAPCPLQKFDSPAASTGSSTDSLAQRSRQLLQKYLEEIDQMENSFSFAPLRSAPPGSTGSFTTSNYVPSAAAAAPPAGGLPQPHALGFAPPTHLPPAAPVSAAAKGPALATAQSSAASAPPAAQPTSQPSAAAAAPVADVNSLVALLKEPPTAANLAPGAAAVPPTERAPSPPPPSSGLVSLFDPPASAAGGDAQAAPPTATTPTEPTPMTDEELEREAMATFGMSPSDLSRMMKGYTQQGASSMSGKASRGSSRSSSRESSASLASPFSSLFEPPSEIGQPDSPLAASSKMPTSSLESVLSNLSKEMTRPTEMSRSPGSSPQWRLRSTLRGHYDGILCLDFVPFPLATKYNPTVPSFLSGSEDGTIKLWSRPGKSSSSSSSKSSSSSDTPVVCYTFRGHSHPVLALTTVPVGGDVFLFSACLGGTVYRWQLPPSIPRNIYLAHDKTRPFQPVEQLEVSKKHRDAIWDIRSCPRRRVVLTACADGTVGIWKYTDSDPKLMLKTLISSPTKSVPTSVDFAPSAPGKASDPDSFDIVVSYVDASVHVFGCQGGAPSLSFESVGTTDGTPNSQINRLAAHPDFPLVFTAHEDQRICIFNSQTGALLHSVVAHRDAVRTLSIHPSGVRLVSGGHDGSIRGWDINGLPEDALRGAVSKFGPTDFDAVTVRCTQELTAHRMKYESSVLCLAHSLPGPGSTGLGDDDILLVSGGADSIVKVFH